MDNSYFKNKYSKDEVSLVEITQIKLQKISKNVTMTSFYGLASNIWEKKYYAVIRREKMPGLCCFLSAKN